MHIEEWKPAPKPPITEPKKARPGRTLFINFLIFSAVFMGSLAYFGRTELAGMMHHPQVVANISPPIVRALPPKIDLAAAAEIEPEIVPGTENARPLAASTKSQPKPLPDHPLRLSSAAPAPQADAPPAPF